MGRREDLIDTARIMFRDAGYRATGIDAILAESGAAKATLYNHFRSKDKLVVAVLDLEDDAFRAELQRRIEAAPDARARILAVFDLARDWFQSPDFNGCVFANAAAEFPDAASEVRETVAAHKAELRGQLVAQLSAYGVKDGSALALQLQMLFEGAIVLAKIDGNPSTADAARSAAEALLAGFAKPQLSLL